MAEMMNPGSALAGATGAGQSCKANAADTPNDTPNNPQRQAYRGAIRAQLAVLRLRFGITEAEALALAALIWGARHG